MKYGKFTQRITALMLAAAFSLTEVSAIPKSVYAESIESSDSTVLTSEYNSTDSRNHDSSIPTAVHNASADITVNTDSSSFSVNAQANAPKVDSDYIEESSSVSVTAQAQVTKAETVNSEAANSDTSKADAPVSKAKESKSTANFSLKSVTILAEDDDVVTGNCGQDSEGNLSDDLTYSYNSTTKELTISAKEDGTGLMKDSMSWDSSVKSAESVILNEGVKSIGINAFNGFANLKYVNKTIEDENIINKFPEGLETIGNSAFISGNNACPITGIVEFPSSLTSIGSNAFRGYDADWSVKNQITEIKFAENMESLTIGNNAFQRSDSLENIDFPKNLTSTATLGSNIFYGCGKLTEITIPGCFVTVSDTNAFDNASITKMTFGEGITSIDAGVCPNTIEEVVLPKTLKAIPDSCFNGCTKLKYVNADKSGETVINQFPEGLETIGQSAFITGNDACPITGIVEFPSTLQSIGASAFRAYDADWSSKNQITEIKFAADTESLTIGNNAFQRCDSLKSVEFSDGMKDLTIGNNAFQTCINLSDFKFPNTLETISMGTNIFTGCTSLEEINVPECFGTVKSGMFKGAPSLKKIILEEGITAIESGAFPASMEEIILPVTITAIPNNCFTGCSNLKYVNKTEFEDGTYGSKFPEKLETIGDGAFRNDNDACPITGIVEFPSTLQSIGANAFRAYDADWSSKNQITEIRFAADTESLTIGNNAFQRCDSLKSVEFSDGMKDLSIGNNAFQTCISLSDFKFPSSLESVSMGTNVFNGCTSLQEINIPKCFGTLKSGIINSAPSLKKIIIEEGITAIESGAFPTSTEEIVLPGTVTEIPNNCFAGCSSLKYVNKTEFEDGTYGSKFPEGLVSINYRAFSSYYDCCPLEGIVEFPSTLKAIGNEAFCTYNDNFVKNNITELRFSDEASELTIGSSAFNYNTNLKKVTIPDSVKKLTINSAAFSNCTGLSGFNFPNALESISLSSNIFVGCAFDEITIPKCFGTVKSGMFSGDTNLKKIILEEGITGLQSGAFPNTMEEIVLPGTVTEIPNNCFAGCSSLKYVNKTEFEDGTYGSKFPEGLVSINYRAFSSYYDCCPLEGIVEFPSTLKAIGNEAFCTYNDNFVKNNITELRFSDEASGLSIGSNAFTNNTNLVKVDFKNITSIGSYAFQNCTNISTKDNVFSLADSKIEYIGYYAFNGCSQLDGCELYLPDNLKKLDSYPFGSSIKFADVYTPLHPFKYNGTNISADTLHFRGIDDSETVTVDGGTYSWSSSLSS
ncbi:MAG: leucine-rich repeat domain-containing protein, partial [Oscillospiraceae bacterium]